MKKIILFLLGMFITLVLICQPAGKQRAILQSGAYIPEIRKSLTASCGSDTLLYPYLKETFNAVPDSFFLDLMTSNKSAWSQAYHVGNTITVEGLQFWGQVYDRANPSQTMTVKAYLYDVDGMNRPTTVLDSLAMTVSTLQTLHTALFPAPVPISGNFAVVIRQVSTTDTLGIMINNARSSTWGEGLAYHSVAGAPWTTASTFWGQDAEPIIAPIVSYSITANFTASSGTAVGAGSTINFTNTSSQASIIENRFLNFNKFASIWGAGIADSTYLWDGGDGSAASYSKNFSHMYTSAGTFFTTLTVHTGFIKDCLDTKNMQFNVSGTTSIGNPKTNDALLIYPQPCTDELNIFLPNCNEATLILYDLSGRMIQQQVLSKDNSTIDTSTLAPGQYTYVVLTSDSNYRGKITKH